MDVVETNAVKEVFIKRLTDQGELSEALSLAWRVFLEYEAPDYTQEGIDEFKKSIHDAEYLAKLTMYAAYREDRMLGVIATRNNGTHIALFFVDGMHHRQGIGRKLFGAALEQNRSGCMTVHSSPYAVPVYHKLGFRDTDTEQTVNGIRFVPMKMTVSQASPDASE